MFMGGGRLGGFGGGLGKKTKMNMGEFEGFDGFNFGGMGGNMGGFSQNFKQKPQGNKASK
jgi:hypothetical protein